MSERHKRSRGWSREDYKLIGWSPPDMSSYFIIESGESLTEVDPDGFILRESRLDYYNLETGFIERAFVARGDVKPGRRINEEDVTREIECYSHTMLPDYSHLLSQTPIKAIESTIVVYSANNQWGRGGINYVNMQTAVYPEMLNTNVFTPREQTGLTLLDSVFVPKGDGMMYDEFLRTYFNVWKDWEVVYNPDEYGILRSYIVRYKGSIVDANDIHGHSIPHTLGEARVLKEDDLPSF